MSRFLTSLLVVLSLGAAASFVAAPFVAFLGVRSAAEAGDVQGLSDLVDFDAVRASLRPQVTTPAAHGPGPSLWDDPVAAIRNALEPITQPTPPAVDAYLTPQALSALTRGAGRAAPRTPMVAPGVHGPFPRVRFWSVNRCRLAVGDGDGAGETIFTFKRSGPFTWKLVHIGLPDRRARADSVPGGTATPAPAR